MENLSCPKCNGELEPKSAKEDITLQQCNKCKGLFVPPGATKRILQHWSAKENPDSGSQAVGQKFDKIDDIDCPKCGVRMDKIQDLDQPHIWTENCSVCGSTFFDAGEMTDLKEKTLSDLIKKIFPPKRA
ncbi:MAG: zf-TFIIB domain-containing protein [Gammaproteobacteria bacterium]